MIREILSLSHSREKAQTDEENNQNALQTHVLFYPLFADCNYFQYLPQSDEKLVYLSYNLQLCVYWNVACWEIDNYLEQIFLLWLWNVSSVFNESELKVSIIALLFYLHGFVNHTVNDKYTDVQMW